MEELKHQIILTEDGSSTIYLPQLNENYHSTHGAVQESKHVFINNGWSHISKKSISILEIGWGTGLNSMLTLLHSIQEKKEVHYTALEAFPLHFNEVEKLNYPSIEIFRNFADAFENMHTCEWEKEVAIHSFFHLHKVRQKLADFCPKNHTFDLIYFDAFAPTIQPEMWSEDVFNKLYPALTSGGILVTYCAKGIVRRTMEKVGFTVERLPGPPGKREMLRAIK